MTKVFKETCQQIVQTGRKINSGKLVEGPWGNISARLDKKEFVAITPSGRSYDTLKARDICLVDLNGKIIKSKYNPSSELALHLAIYKARPDVKAIVHTHSIYASACSAADQVIPAIMEDLVQIVGGEVAVAEYKLPGSEELAHAAVKALADKSAALLSHHGVVACARSLQEAVTIANIVEKTAKIFVIAKQLGSIEALSADDTAVLRKFYLEKYSRQQLVED